MPRCRPRFGRDRRDAIAELGERPHEPLLERSDRARVNFGRVRGKEALGELGKGEIGTHLADVEAWRGLVAEVGERRCFRTEAATETATAVLVPADAPACARARMRTSLFGRHRISF